MKCMDKHEFEQQNVFGTGAANTAYAKFFIGQSFLNPLTDPKTGLFLANVTFEPGCRNNWHIHHAAKGGAHLCSIQYYLRFWLGICRTSLTVSVLRIMRYCLKNKIQPARPDKEQWVVPGLLLDAFLSTGSCAGAGNLLH